MQYFPNEGTHIIYTIGPAQTHVNIDHRLRHVMASHPPGCVQIGRAYWGTFAKQYLQNVLAGRPKVSGSLGFNPLLANPLEDSSLFRALRAVVSVFAMTAWPLPG